MRHGIAAHFYWRQVIMILAVIIVVPILLLPIYEKRALDIVGTQGEVFANTTLGATRESLYKEDFTQVIQYTQRVLQTTRQILQVFLKLNDGRVIRIDAKSWSLIDSEDAGDLALVENTAALYESQSHTFSAFTYAAPVNISKYRWGDIYIDIDGRAYQQLISNFWVGYATVSALLLFGSMIFLWFSARPVVRQLSAFSAVAQKIGDGQFVRANEDGIGEIAGLASALNMMTDSLEEKTQRIDQLARVIRETNEAIMLFDANGVSLFANQAMAQLLQQSEQQLSDVNIWKILGQLSLSEQNLTDVRNAIESRKGFIWSADTRLDTTDNDISSIHLAVKLEVLSKTQDALSGFVLALSDITARKALENRLERLALFDTLTGLPNRRSFGLEIEKRVAQGKPFSVMFMDLDNFKVVNDSLGHEAGDQLLIIVSQRLLNCLPPDCLIARLGGDEFTALIGTKLENAVTETMANAIIKSLEEPIQLSDSNVTIGVSIGVVHYPENGDTAAELVKNADIAMYEVKKHGRNNFCVFSQTMQHRVSESLSIEAGLREAIQNNELELAYQPIVLAKNRTLVSAEALLRWPDRNIPPAVFVSVAERSNLIVLLDNWVFRAALTQLARWHAEGKKIKLSINVSGKHISQPSFATRFLTLAKSVNAPLHSVQLEITENNLVDRRDASVASLIALRNAGCKIAVDDFGTGYSSLSYLTSLPIHVVKLDKSFTLNREGDRRAKSISNAVIRLTHDLAMTTIAEGVESEQQALQLTEQGCHCLQGYHIARPMSQEQLEEQWLSKLPTAQASELVKPNRLTSNG